jgi:hypothetical protein
MPRRSEDAPDRPAEGFGREEPDEEVEPDDALALIRAASIAGRSAIGGRHSRRYQVINGRENRLPPRCAACDGYTVHAGTAVGGRDSEGRERLCRYLARPALARPRLAELPDGRVLLELKTPWSDGTASLTFTAEVRSVGVRCVCGHMRGLCRRSGFSRDWSARREAHLEVRCSSLEPRVWGARRVARVRVPNTDGSKMFRSGRHFDRV